MTRGVIADTQGKPASTMRLVIVASSLGTVFEWYDFFLYGTLAVFFGGLFFPPGNATLGLLASLFAFAAGFLVRPFGAIFFGRLGDIIGRKYTFLVTMTLMGISTAGVGLLPTYAEVGVVAPALLFFLRLAQGLALGGEYGGAATYIAEYAPEGRRGYYTSYIQTTATLGLFLSLIVIYLCRASMSDADFKSASYLAGWRIPFLLSFILLGVSLYIRMKLQESPVFAEMKASGKASRKPLTDSFGNWANLKYVLLALFGATAGQGVVWYGGQFYALYFLQTSARVTDYGTAYTLIATALGLGTGFFVFFGWLSDRIGRKPIIMAGLLLAAVTYFPIFHGLMHYANPALEKAQANSPVTVAATGCTARFFKFTPATEPCDKAREYLSNNGIAYTNVPPVEGQTVVVKLGDAEIDGFDAAQYKTAIAKAGYPASADEAQMNKPMVILLLFLLVLYVTMVYGPIAAFLVELFPTRIRYTSMSLPYHIGNGWFGGFLPLTASALVVATGDIYYGLWYPVGVALLSLVVGIIFIRETRNNSIRDVGADRA
jgi:MFS family permease